MMGVLSILNQLSDLGTDRANHRRFLISDGKVSPTAAWLLAGLMLLPFLIISIKNLNFFIVASIELLLWGLLYNFPPFRWSGRPVLGLLTNLVGGLLAVVLGWTAVSDGFEWHVIFLGVPYLFGTGAIYLLTTVPDTSGDAKHNKITSAVFFGKNRTRWAAVLMIILAMAAAALISDWKMLFTATISLPFFIWAAIQQNETETLRAIRYGVLFMSLAVILYHPWFLLLLAFTFFLSRWYYINRFGLNYPTLKVKE
jgi:4-hydroxybenzoate polyprenyltransferase